MRLLAAVLALAITGGAQARSAEYCQQFLSEAMTEQARSDALSSCLLEPEPVPQAPPPAPKLRRVTDAQAITLAKNARAAAVNQLKDPDSARFRALFISDAPASGDSPALFYLCGEVNAKNSYGGYTGFQKFASTDSYAYFEGTSDSERAAFREVIWPKCERKVRDVK